MVMDGWMGAREEGRKRVSIVSYEGQQGARKGSITV